MKRFKVYICMKGSLTSDILFEWYFGTDFSILNCYVEVNGRSLKEAVEKPIGAKEEMKVVEFSLWGEVMENRENLISNYTYHTVENLIIKGLEVISKTSCYYSIEDYGRPHNYIRLAPEGE